MGVLSSAETAFFADGALAPQPAAFALATFLEADGARTVLPPFALAATTAPDALTIFFFGAWSSALFLVLGGMLLTLVIGVALLAAATEVVRFL